MCEFCSFGPNSDKTDRDSSNPVFSGFFSAAAIEAAVRQATRQKELSRRTLKAQNKKRFDDNHGLQDDSGSVQSDRNNRGTDDDDDASSGGEEADDDGT
jgi:hypothetical protein